MHTGKTHQYLQGSVLLAFCHRMHSLCTPSNSSHVPCSAGRTGHKVAHTRGIPWCAQRLCLLSVYNSGMHGPPCAPQGLWPHAADGQQLANCCLQCWRSMKLYVCKQSKTVLALEHGLDGDDPSCLPCRAAQSMLTRCSRIWCASLAGRYRSHTHLGEIQIAECCSSCLRAQRRAVMRQCIQLHHSYN